MATKLKTHRLHILITPSQYEKLKGYADSQNQSISDVVRQYVENFDNTLIK